MKRTIICVLLTACAWGQAVKPINHPMYPDPKLTPGASDPAEVAKPISETICKVGYTTSVRNVTDAEKAQVRQRYGLTLADTQRVEIVNGKRTVTPLGEYDHWRSLELLGSNDVTNLWFQFYDPAPGQINYLGARTKDVAEKFLNSEICPPSPSCKRCTGAITVQEAWQQLNNWPAIYQKLQAEGKAGSK
jgi:hypothetical protein